MTSEAWPLLTMTTRAERAAIRAGRTIARRYAELGVERKEVSRELGASEAELAGFTTLHRTQVKASPLLELAAEPLMEEPVNARTRELAARRKLLNYKPTWADRALSRETERRRELVARVAEAARQDSAEYAARKRACDAHNEKIRMAQGLLTLDPISLRTAIAGQTSLAALGRAANGLAVARSRSGLAVFRLHVLHLEDLPEHRIGPGGELQPLLPSERRELHLAYVCSAALRTALELAGLLPGEFLVVAECDADLDNGMGRIGLVELPVSAQAIRACNPLKRGAVDLARELSARFQWTPQHGFAPLIPLEAA